MNEHLRKVASHHDSEAEIYDSDYFERFDLYHRVTLDNIRRFVPEKKEATVLDAGGGTGIWSVELAKMGYHITLTDISKGMLKKAQEKVKKLVLEKQIRILTSNICDMPEFPDSHFDMVLCEGDPISYCGDHKKALGEVVRVTKPGGVVITSVDSRMSALNWLYKEGDPDAVDRLLETGEVLMPTKTGELSYPVHAFTPQELKGLFQSNGLSVERIIGKLVLAPRLPWYRSEDPSLQEWLYELELEYNDNPAFYPCAGHLEIVGRKQ